MTYENWILFWRIAIFVVIALISVIGAWRIQVNETKIKIRDKSTASTSNQFKDFDNVVSRAKVDSVKGHGIVVDNGGKTIIQDVKVSNAGGNGITISDKPKSDKK